MSAVALRRIPWERSEAGGPLGRHVEHDDASRAYAVTATAAIRSVLHARRGGIFDQGQIGSCTGNAGAGVLNTVPFVPANGRTTLRHERDAVSFYHRATIIDGFPGVYPPDDTGSSGLAVAKVLKAARLIAEYRHAFSLDSALRALMSTALMTGTDWLEGMDEPDGNGVVTVTGDARGGHEYVVRGFEPAATNEPKLDGLVFCDNSWTASWGLRGSFKMTARAWGDLLERQGDVTILVPRVVTASDFRVG